MKSKLIIIFLLFFLPTYSQAVLVLPEVEKLKTQADSLFVNKRYEEAILRYSKVITVNAKDKISLFRRGMCYFIIKNNLKAIEDFSSLIEIDDRNSSAYYFRGLSKFNIASKSEHYDAEKNSAACDDLFMAKQLGYQTDYVPLRTPCPNL